MKVTRITVLILITFLLVSFLTGCSRAVPPATSEPAPTPTVAQAETPGLETARPPEGEGSKDKDTAVGDILVTQTPEPTATPDRVAQEVSRITRASGLARKSFLGLGTNDWINLGISFVYVLIAYAIGSLVTHGVLRWAVGHTSTEFGDALRNAIDPYLRWLVVVLALSFATRRLAFLEAELKAFLTDLYFVLGLVLSFIVVWRLINLAHNWYRERLAQQGRAEELDPVLILFTRASHIGLVVVGLTVLLSHFGINVTSLIAALGIGGLAFSLAAQDTLADAISGFIILADRPYRVGDRIEIQGEGTWGDVVEIGLRTTRIRTRDNRMVIVPNSMIGRNQVVNYTYPDPRYRIETHVKVAYGADIDTVRRTIVGAVRGVEGVLPDKPVDALYIEMGDWAMVFRVRWWIESYVDTRRIYDRVHAALQEALDEAGIEMPYPTQSFLLHRDGSETPEQKSNLVKRKT